MSPLLCWLDRLQQKLLLCILEAIFQWVKWLRDGIVLVVSLLAAIVKDLVALSKWSTFLCLACLHGLIVAALPCTYYNYPMVTQT